MNRRGFALTLVVAAACACIPLFARTRPSEVWELPPAFHGLITVRYSMPSCPSLPHEGDRIVYRVPETGTLCTSDPLPQGAAVDRFEVVYPTGERVRLKVPDEVDKLGVVDGLRLYLFVGSPSEQAEAWRRLR